MLIKKKKLEEILEEGKGPVRVSYEKPEDKNAARFSDEGYKSDFSLFEEKVADKAASMHRENREEKLGKENYKTREFSYNVYEDPLFQQYIKTAKKNGERAMTDTMAKAASQTGGIAGSYAVGAGVNAYNEYMESANEVIPELYDLAYQKFKDDLARDLAVAEFEEAERWEDAEYKRILNSYQEEGKALSDEEKDIIYINGGYIDGDFIVDESGNRYEKGTKADDEAYRMAYNDYEQNGPYNMSPENFGIMQNYHTWDDKKGVFSDSTLGDLRWGGTTPVDRAILAYRSGKELSEDDYLILYNNGYDIDGGLLYFGGEPVEKMYEAPEGMPSDLSAAISAVTISNQTGRALGQSYIDVLAKYGFVYRGGRWVQKESGVPLLEYFK